VGHVRICQRQTAAAPYNNVKRGGWGHRSTIYASARATTDQMFRRFFARVSEFLSEVKAEIKKMSFPSRPETLASTGVVLILVLILSIFLSSMDHILVRLVKAVIG